MNKGVIIVILIFVVFFASLFLWEDSTLQSAKAKAQKYCIEKGYEEYKEMRKPWFSPDPSAVNCVTYFNKDFNEDSWVV